ncbi:oligopeptide/dipeptide ABC transporter ATP-binding protein [Mumia flava]|uniref:Oligopeptide/dipeptide ABC transporter ATP-binding protein n=1 Tax=Mumia flava TaxID=1348852 RepID=A0A2M9BGM2_9ACTN|nr:ABC transporter ATP-binding protein [Mumia flava]PJJ57091.1 oligopeptide/dipeptide ABC transporter ATP-binding protein [Mumia flava]
MSATGRTEPLLRIDDLAVDLDTADGPRPLLHGVSLEVAAGEAFGLVGESGSGKSLTARSVIRLLGPTMRTRGRVLVDGDDVTAMRPAALRRLRSREVGMIFQDPKAHINPVRTVGDFLCEAMVTNGRTPRRDAEGRATALLTEVGIGDAARRMRQHPHELSGGLLQRVMIASVLAVEPRLILADEPTTALDVTTQEEVMAILGEQQRERGLAMLFITHDLELASAVCDRIGVMYAGRVAETLPASALGSAERHPYTRGLLAARPSLDGPREGLRAIPGRPLPAYEAGDGCAFADRCAHVRPPCHESRPPLRPYGASEVACHRTEVLGEHPPLSDREEVAADA